MSNSNGSGGGIGFFGLLTLLFIGLKLGGVIDWSWLWVLAPLWAPVVGVLGVLAVAFIVAGVWIGGTKLFIRKRKPIDPTQPNRVNLRGR